MEKSSFFDSVNVGGVWDRPWRAPDFASYFASFIGNGVFPNPSNNLQVIANDDMTVTVKAGKGWINGYYYENTDDLILSIDVADGVLDRIDTVVLQYRGLVDDGRKIVVQIKKGAYKSDPVAQSLQRDSDIYELKLADIIISHGAIKITQADITDTRLDKSVCGVVSQMVQTVDTTTLFNQYKSWYEQTTGKAIKDITAFEVQFKADTIAWLNALKEVLDKNTAANLLNLINELKSTTYTKSQTDLTRTYTLTHSKSGAVHTLAGLPTGQGIFQCQFIATADYTEGDTFEGYTAKPNGEETTLPNKAFISGDIVSVTVDVGGKKLGFKLGGGGGYGTLSPQIKSFTAKAGNHEITINWTNPSDSNFAGLYLVRKQGSMPIKLSDRTKIDVGKATSYTDNEPENGKIYYYRAFPYNAKKQVQTELTGAVVNATPKEEIRLGDLPVGSLIRTTHNNRNVNCIILNQNYQKLVNLYQNTDRTTFLQVDAYSNQDTSFPQPNYSQSNYFKNHLEIEFLNQLDSKFVNRLITIKIPHVVDGNVQAGTNGLSCKIFPLSAEEMNGTFEVNGSKKDGVILDYFNVPINERRLRWIKFHKEWTRSTIEDFKMIYINIDKKMESTNTSYHMSCRPVVVLDYETLISPVPNPDGSYNIVF